MPPKKTILAALTILCMSINTHTHADTPTQTLLKTAQERTETSVRYDGSYVGLSYPNGDVNTHTGVCTDLVIRAYRGMGIDLQQKVHEDMRENFALYPSKRIWGLSRPDSNIDHRRVPNLQTYFTRYGQTLAISQNAADYKAGDIVTWMLTGNLPHIGIVANERSNDGLRPLIFHNIGLGPVLDDSLFEFAITGHYRYALDANALH
jgi:uncharacterized protein YijF (DUF1287 family)